MKLNKEYHIQNYLNRWRYHISYGRECSDDFREYGRYWLYHGPNSKEIKGVLDALGIESFYTKKKNIDYLRVNAKKGINRNFHEYMFRFLRYGGHPDLRGIIINTYNAVQAGCNPTAALILGHYYKESLGYYSSSMDMLGYIGSREHMHLPFDTVEEFYERTNTPYSATRVFHKMKITKSNPRNIIIDLVSKEKYLEAEKLLYKWKQKHLESQQ